MLSLNISSFSPSSFILSRNKLSLLSLASLFSNFPKPFSLSYFLRPLSLFLSLFSLISVPYLASSVFPARLPVNYPARPSFFAFSHSILSLSPVPFTSFSRYTPPISLSHSHLELTLSTMYSTMYSVPQKFLLTCHVSTFCRTGNGNLDNGNNNGNNLGYFL